MVRRNETKGTAKWGPGSILGVSIIIVAVAALVIIFLAWGQWWPSGTDWYLTIAAGFFLLLLTGIIWLALSIAFVLRYRRFNWWILVWPTVTILGLAVAFASQPDFEDARPQFEEVAQQLLDDPGSTDLDGLTLGRFEIRDVLETDQGEVYFMDARTTMFSTESGWVYSPGGAPTGRNGELTAEHIDGPWYRYQLVITF